MVLALTAVTIKLPTGVSKSLIVKSIPYVLAGSEGSLITLLIPAGLIGGTITPPSK